MGGWCACSHSVGKQIRSWAPTTTPQEPTENDTRHTKHDTRHTQTHVQANKRKVGHGSHKRSKRRRTAASTSSSASPRNGAVPVNSIYSITPTLHRSHDDVAAVSPIATCLSTGHHNINITQPTEQQGRQGAGTTNLGCHVLRRPNLPCASAAAKVNQSNAGHSRRRLEQEVLEPAKMRARPLCSDVTSPPRHTTQQRSCQSRQRT